MSLYKFDPEDAKRFGREQRIAFQEHGKELRFKKCPYCRNVTDDKNTFAINLQTGQFKCLRASCGAHGNMITLSKDFDFSLGTEVDEYYNRRKRYRNLRKTPVPETRTPAVQYLQGRGISRDIAESYHMTTRKDADNILVFPFYDDQNVLQFVKYRKTDFQKGVDKSKEWCEANCKPILFGMDHCDPEASKTLILTEGQLDSLSVAEAGVPNAVSVPTGANGFTWVPYCWDFLEKFDTLIVFGDHEHDRITLLDEMRTRFHGMVKHVRPKDYLGEKDANDILRNHGAAAIRTAIENAVPVENPEIVRLADVERRPLSQMVAVNTGIPSLNKMVGGFFLGQLVLLTGDRGLGKSTVGSQFILEAVRQGFTALIYSGELQGWQVQDWIDRQAAGPGHINRQITSLGFENYAIDAEAELQIHDWYRNRLYMRENDLDGFAVTPLLEIITQAIQQYGARVLLIDNVMTAVADDLAYDLYRQQSAFVRELSHIAKRHEVLIFLVAHPRKKNGRDFVNDDVSGSSNMTNLADIILNYAEAKPDYTDAPRVLQITKNRMTGKIDKRGIPLWFEEASKRIAEEPGQFGWTCGWEEQKEEEEWTELDLEEIPF